MKYIQGGQMTVGGRPGIIWYLQFGEDRLSGFPPIVMSADPELAELGRAMLRQTEVSLRLSGAIFGNNNPMAGVLEVLKTGAPLQFNGMMLGTVTHAPIAPERFAIPATPETLEQVRTCFEENGGRIP
ncbi:MAG: hypothetical protein ACAH11_01745 [Sphingomonas sp.]